MEFKELVDACVSAGYDVRSYSGRGMNGKRCLGIDTYDSPISVVLGIVKEALGGVYYYLGDRAYESLGDVADLCDSLKDAKADSMGNGSIVYFPKIEWEEMEVDEDSEED